MASDPFSDQPPEEGAHHTPGHRRRRQQRPRLTPSAAVVQSLVRHSFSVPIGSIHLTGELGLPSQATGLILISHCLGDSRFSWRSRYFSHLLQQADLGTFSLDLLTPEEERRQHLAPPPLALLTERLVQSAEWTQRQPGLLGLRLGLLGENAASTAALVACSQLGSLVGGIVCLGGQLTDAIPAATAPTLLLVGDQDVAGLHASQQTQRRLGAASQVHTLAQTDHFFREPTTVAQAADEAATWFNKYLAKPRPM